MTEWTYYWDKTIIYTLGVTLLAASFLASGWSALGLFVGFIYTFGFLGTIFGLIRLTQRLYNGTAWKQEQLYYALSYTMTTWFLITVITG
jgi:uncharacterized membrane protein required for colicin V production